MKHPTSRVVRNQPSNNSHRHPTTTTTTTTTTTATTTTTGFFSHPAGRRSIKFHFHNEFLRLNAKDPLVTNVGNPKNKKQTRIQSIFFKIIKHVRRQRRKKNWPAEIWPLSKINQRKTNEVFLK